MSAETNSRLIRCLSHQPICLFSISNDKMFGYLFCIICLRSRLIKSKDICVEGGQELSDDVNELDSDIVIKSILSLETVDTDNVICNSTSSDEDLYLFNRFANFNRGPAGGMRTFIVSMSNNVNDS